MKISAIPARSLGDDLVRKWRALQQGNPDLRSPFFCPEFTLAVAAAREDVFVGLLEQEGEVVGFFPFQRGERGVGKPVGWPMCDYQGIVASKETVWDAKQLLRGCGLVQWDFDHLIMSQLPFQSFHQARKESPILNLSAGYDRYAEEKRRSGSELFKQSARKTRKLGREVGPVRFEPELVDHATLDQLLCWWAEKWTSGRRVREWAKQVLHTVLEKQTKDFAGVLSAVYAGDELVAMNFGMRSRTVWHYWFPAYNKRFAKYSTGIILLMKMAAVAPSLGIEVLDLGAGGGSYKSWVMNDAIPIAEGSVEVPSMVASARNFRRRLEGEIRQRPLVLASARTAVTVLRTVRRKLFF
jgi:CelD/BcsL family acetyltransferase involved in cellulose biosynthesis